MNFDIISLTWLVVGIALLLMGIKNYKSQKEEFDVRYFRYGMGINFLLMGLLRTFTGKTPLWMIVVIILIFITTNILTHIKRKKHIK